MPLLVPAVSALALGAVVVTGAHQLGPSSTATSTSSSSSGSHAHRGGDRVPGGPLVRRWYAGVSASDRACLARHDVTTHPGAQTAADRLALLRQVQSAARACDVAFPQADRVEKRLEFWAGLTADQRACLEKISVQRPIGPATKAQRQAWHRQVRQAAASCGVTLPRRDGSARGAGSTHAG